MIKNTTFIIITIITLATYGNYRMINLVLTELKVTTSNAIKVEEPSEYHNNKHQNETKAKPVINTHIFYFVYIPLGSEHWNWLVASQLKDLKATGLLDVALLNVIVATELSASAVSSDIREIKNIVQDIAGANATVLPRYKNRFEYWGLCLMWEKA